jgi:hypothetical protein
MKSLFRTSIATTLTLCAMTSGAAGSKLANPLGFENTSVTTNAFGTTETLQPQGKPFSASVVLRDGSRTMTLQPGEMSVIASVCADGEAIVGGGPSGLPASLSILFSSLFYDGVHSGWFVELKNITEVEVTETPHVAALCVKGTLSQALSAF